MDSFCHNLLTKRCLDRKQWKQRKKEVGILGFAFEEIHRFLGMPEEDEGFGLHLLEEQIEDRWDNRPLNNPKFQK
jgi:hypothetical protein